MSWLLCKLGLHRFINQYYDWESESLIRYCGRCEAHINAVHFPYKGVGK